MRRQHLWVLGGAGLLLVLCLLMLSRIERRMVVSIDGITLPSGQAVTVGRESAVCYDQVPHDYLTIHHTGEELVWQVNPRWLRSDSLCYFKVNGKNPNLHPLSSGDSIAVDVCGERQTLSAARVSELLDGQQSRYVMLRHVFRLDRRLRGESLTADDAWAGVRSFLYRPARGHGWSLMLLDRRTTLLTTGGLEVTYLQADTLRGEEANVCKVQFFKMVEYSIRPDKPIPTLFHIDSVNYLAKPLSMATAWGAGHVTVQTTDEGFSISYSKPVTYTCTASEMGDLSPGGTHQVTIHQADGSFPTAGSAYVPLFSTSVSNDVCHIQQRGDSLLAATATPSPLRMRTLDITRAYILSFLWLPLLAAMLSICGLTLAMKPRRSDLRHQAAARSSLVGIYPLIVAIALLYYVCKVMITLKLAHTYPYFEQTAAIAVATAVLSISLLYLLTVIINQGLLADERQGRGHGFHRRTTAIATGIALLALGTFALRSIPESLTQSYLPNELGDWRVWRWHALPAVTDTYLSVPYTLLLAGIIALVLLAVTSWSSATRWFDAVTARAGHAMQSLPRPVYALWPAALVFAVSLLPGNYSTALITLAMVPGLSWSLRRITFNRGRLKAYVQMSMVTLVYLAAAIAFGDKGYVTNYPGILAATSLLYLMSAKGKAMRHERRSTLTVAAILLLAAIAAPRLLPLKYDTDEVSYDRAARRFEMFAQFDKYLNSGYRYAVADAEFMTVLSHYMYNTDGSDPLSPERHSLHPSISTGQSPVVLNDVAVPSCLFGAYGLLSYVVFFGLIVLLCATVLPHVIRVPATDEPTEMSSQTVWRLLSLSMWVSTTLYLYLSYVGATPFTGRLCPGLGIDAVGEALESTLLLAFMTATAYTPANRRHPATSTHTTTQSPWN